MTLGRFLSPLLFIAHVESSVAAPPGPFAMLCWAQQNSAAEAPGTRAGALLSRALFYLPRLASAASSYVVWPEGFQRTPVVLGASLREPT